MLRHTLPSLARLALAAVTALTLVAVLLVAAPTAARAETDASLHIRDYNGDGATDVLTVSDGGQLGLYAGNGRGGWDRSTLVGGGWSGYTLITPGDFDSDGRSDLLATSPSGELYLYAGTGDGFAVKVQIGHGWQGMTEVFSPGDFNGDGPADVIATTASGDMRIYYGNGAGRIDGSAKIGFGWHVFTDIVAGGDFNADGRADIFARDDAGRLFAYYNRGDNAMSARVQVGQGWGSYADVSSVGDFTGDGPTDVFGINTRTGEAYVYPGTGEGGFASRIELGTGWQAPTPGRQQELAPEPEAPAPSGDFGYERDQLFQRLNALRASRGLAPVARSAELNAQAQAWAVHMAETQNMYHTPNFSAKMRAAGWSYKSELIVRNTGGRQMDTEDILSFMHGWWVASPGHYPWMVSPNYTHVGHGYHMGPGGPYAVTVLGGR